MTEPINEHDPTPPVSERGPGDCPVSADCEGTVRGQQLMCRRHWFTVPHRLRTEVWAAWRARLAAEDGPEDVFEAAVDLHERVKREAITAARNKEASRG